VRRSLATLIALILLSDLSNAATPKPSPLPTIKASVKTTTKPSAKISGTSKAKSGTTVKKKTYKRYVRKRVKTVPSPSPKWPPANFTNSGLVYAKIPSADELKSYASNSTDITIGLKDCEKLTCGAVFLASESGCNWWQIDSMVTGPSKSGNGIKETLGTLKTMAPGSRAKKIVAVLLKSTEPIQQGVAVSGITARCWSTDKPDGIPSNTYIPTPTSSATPTH
jgi:hypothetical protein